MRDVLTSASCVALALSLSLASTSAKGQLSAIPGAQAAFGDEAIETDAVDTNLNFPGINPANIRSFEVAGFRLGMSLKEANRVASKAGFTRMPLRGNRNYSFEGRARLLANNSLSNPLPIPRHVPEHSGAVGNGDKRILIDWIPTANGVRIHKVSFDAPTEGNDPAVIVAQMERKYGPPTLRDNTALTWCGTKVRQCSGFVTERPRMVAEIGKARFHITLDGGLEAKDANERAIKARAAQLAGSRAKPVSF